MGIRREYGLIVGAVLLAAVLAAPVDDRTQHVDLFMPGVHPQVNDTYMCRSLEVEEDVVYITGFIPHADMKVAHHILLFGCQEPGDVKEKAWNCGEMVAPDTSYTVAPVCGGDSQQTIYAWAMDAPALSLPKGVGFKVGRNTDIKHLVLQVHYKDVTPFVEPNKGIDYDSGITLIETSQPQPRTAGTYLLIAGGDLAPQSVTYMEAACNMEENLVMHPFAFRTHTHQHGVVVSGYRVREGEWTEIGRRNPQDPQMFYNTTTPDMEIEKGDVIASRCTMKNDEDRVVNSGSTTHDEMCDFYVMYWVDGNEILPSEESVCYTPGTPSWHWTDFSELHPENVPEDASLVPGTEEVVKESPQQFEAEDMNNENENGGYQYMDQGLEENIRDEFLELLEQEMERHHDNAPYFINEPYQGVVQDEYPGYYDNGRYGQDSSRYGQDNSRYGQDNSRYGQDNSRYGQDNGYYGQDNYYGKQGQRVGPYDNEILYEP